MANVREITLSLLALLGLLVSFTPASASLASPAPAAMPMSMAQGSGCDRRSMPAGHEAQRCATLCCAVLPSLPSIEARPPLAFAPVLGRLQPLSGINPGLDPPPPRAA